MRERERGGNYTIQNAMANKQKKKSQFFTLVKLSNTHTLELYWVYTFVHIYFVLCMCLVVVFKLFMLFDYFVTIAVIIFCFCMIVCYSLSSYKSKLLQRFFVLYSLFVDVLLKTTGFEFKFPLRKFFFGGQQKQNKEKKSKRDVHS